MVFRYFAVGFFVLLTAAIGAMLIPTFIWIFSFGLLPDWVAYLLMVPSGGFTGYWGYQHTVDKDWLEPD